MMLDPSFFQMDSTCIRYWHTVVDNLMTHDKTTYKDLMCKFLSHDNTMGLDKKNCLWSFGQSKTHISLLSYKD